MATMTLDQMDPNILESLIKRVSIAPLRENPKKQQQRVIGKKELSSISNTVTSLRNVFNRIYVYDKNITHIHDMETDRLEEMSKEKKMESKSGASITPSVSSGPGFGALTDLIPKLTSVVEDLTDNFEELDLSKSGSSLDVDVNVGKKFSMPKMGKLGKGAMIAGGAAAVIGSGAMAYNAMSGGESSDPEVAPPQERETSIKRTGAPVKDTSRQATDTLTRQAVKVVNKPGSSPTSTPAAGSEKGFASRFASFIGNTFQKVTSFVANLPSQLASMASTAGGAIMGGLGDLASMAQSGYDAVTSGGQAADMEQAITRSGITDPVTKAQIMAQTAHESGNFRYTKELGNDSYFRKYEGRRDLGNVQPGDGLKYKGRGFLQTTGRANYAELSNALGVDFINNPQWLESPRYAALSAMVWFRKRWNRLQGNWNNTRAITRVVNGGYNGLADREAKFAQYSRLYSGGGSVSNGAAGFVQNVREGAGNLVSGAMNAISNVAGNFMDFFSAQPSVDMSGMKQPFLERLKAMGSAYKQQTGRKIIIASAFRSRAKQEELYRLYLSGRGNPAARPGTSKHESGLAIDLNRDQADWLERTGMLARFGMHRPDRRASERQHVEPIEGARLTPAPDNPYSPGTPIATVGRGSNPVGLGNGVASQIPSPAPIGSVASNIAINRTVSGSNVTTNIAVGGGCDCGPGSTGSNVPSYLAGTTGPKSPPAQSNPGPKNQYLSYFGALVHT